MTKNKIRVLYIISGMGVGGAENQLGALIRKTNNTNNITLVVLTGAKEVVERVNLPKIEIHHLNIHQIIQVPLALLKLFWIVNRNRPSIISSWLYDANLIGFVIARILHIPHVSNIRSSEIIRENFSKNILHYAVKFVAKHSQLVIANSFAGKNLFLGKDSTKVKYQIIQNGIDTEKFNFSDKLRLGARKDYSVSTNTFLIGFAGRLDPIKNYAKFLSNFSMYAKNKNSLVKLLMAGDGYSSQNAELKALIEELGIRKNVILLGDVRNMEFFYCSLDCFVLYSKFEAFPNVLAESMACQRLCLSTNVGDVKQLLLPKEFILNDFSFDELKIKLNYVRSLSVKQKTNIGEMNRQLIVSNYSLNKMSQKFLTEYEGLCPRS